MEFDHNQAGTKLNPHFGKRKGKSRNPSEGKDVLQWKKVERGQKCPSIGCSQKVSEEKGEAAEKKKKTIGEKRSWGRKGGGAGGRSGRPKAKTGTRVFLTQRWRTIIPFYREGTPSGAGKGISYQKIDK